jgi:Protein of unknown function (DUF1579)
MRWPRPAPPVLLLALALHSIILAACAEGPPAPAGPRLPAAADCSGPEYRALDFWIGEWDVRSPGGDPLGSNHIVSILDGCAVREMWTDARGGKGESLFFHDRALGRWRQVWVTSDGSWKEKTEIEASREPASPARARSGRSIRFQGEVLQAQGGTALDRTTLTALADGRVRQVIEVSPDRGSTWSAWEGVYTRRAHSCNGAHRELDFWIGDWDLVIRARKAPGKDEWAVARGRNRISSVLGGCAIEEDFTADGPSKPWSGKSLSRWVEPERRWRQAWVDDDGGYIALTGGRRGDEVVFEAEPSVRDGKPVQMRMVFTDITASAILWRWEATRDNGASWSPMLIIEYRRAAPRRPG